MKKLVENWKRYLDEDEGEAAEIEVSQQEKAKEAQEMVKTNIAGTSPAFQEVISSLAQMKAGGIDPSPEINDLIATLQGVIKQLEGAK